MQVIPAGFWGDPKDPFGNVFVPAFQQLFELLSLDAVLFQFGMEFVAAGLEGIGDVFEKQQPQDHVLVFGGIDLAPEGIRRLPESVGVGQVGWGIGIAGHEGRRGLGARISGSARCLTS